MNFKEDIEGLIHLARLEAESREERLKIQKRLFIFAIEIGRRRKLTPDQRSFYEKTFLTAHVLSGMAERNSSPSAFDQIADGALENWLDLEPKVKEWLEQALGYSLAETEKPTSMTPELRQILTERLTALYGNDLPPAEIARLVERLEFPLDRA